LRLESDLAYRFILKGRTDPAHSSALDRVMAHSNL